MHAALARFLLVLSMCIVHGAASAQVLTPRGSLELTGQVVEPEQLSGIAFFNDFLIVCPDERASFNILEPSANGSYAVTSTVELLEDDEAEIDLEGATSDEKYVYLIGSHALARKAVEEDRSYKKNRDRLSEIKEHVGADSLFRLRLDDDGSVTSQEHISLRNLLNDDRFLNRFTGIPSKENGIDIEGIAAKDGKLFIGFRGPVLRGNFVPVIVLRFKEPHEYELRFVNLNGPGIRDITAVADGFLLIGGPVGDGEGTYNVYFWDGKDCIPGEGAPGGAAVHLGTLPPDIDAKYEGIALTSEKEAFWDTVVVRDGETTATRFRIPKP